MKQSIKDLVLQCVNYTDVVSLLKDLDWHISSNTNYTIQANYYAEVWIIDELNTLSKEELKEFINQLEDAFIVQIKTINNSFNTKLYQSFNQQINT